jgi:regulatory protein
MPKQLTPQTALNRAQWLCSQREKCLAEIKLKLTQWGIGADDAQSILITLVSDGFINESRFALTFARDKARFNKWGPKKIEMALRAKRISKEDIEQALTEIEEFTSTENLTELLTKKAKTIKYKDAYDLKTKLIRFALSRGFEYGKVMGVIGSIVDNNRNQPPI